MFYGIKKLNSLNGVFIKVILISLVFEEVYFFILYIVDM